MNQELKQCQNCHNEFTIEPDDFVFYEKMRVPPPTFCPDCRMQRRMAFRNERTLYKRTCSKCQKNIISIYPSITTFPVYCYSCWWSDDCDPLSYGTDFDEKTPFLEQVKLLKLKVPRLQTANAVESRLINSEYSNSAIDLKNCYLTFASIQNEDCSYANYIMESQMCIDMLNCIKSENSYDCFDITNCYHLAFSQSCAECRDSIFLYDCKNCSHCIGCVGLRNQQYYIFNKKYSKEEYEKEKKKLQLNTYSGIESARKKFSQFVLQFPHKYYHGYKNNNFQGDYVWNTESVNSVFYTADARNVKHTFWCYGAQDVYDYLAWGGVELSYELVECGDQVYGCKFSHQSWSQTRNLQYCDFCLTSSDCFGCVGLRNKKYCILNQQYNKEDYEKIKQTIIKQMQTIPYKDRVGRLYHYGEFFPIELSPYHYNDTIALEHFPISSKEASSLGYAWNDEEEKSYSTTTRARDLPESIGEVGDAILQEVIGCEHSGQCKHRCTSAFKITQFELQFYRKFDLPLPHLCHNCRHYRRLEYRNPLKLWKRSCECNGKKSEKGEYQNTTAHFHGEETCPNTFETAYAPERKEIVYCEQCYNAEVA